MSTKLQGPESALPNGGRESTHQVTRRGLLTFVVSAPVATVGAGFGANLATPSTAHALPLPLTPPDYVDYYDVGDAIVQRGLADDAAGEADGGHRRPRAARPAAARIRHRHRHRRGDDGRRRDGRSAQSRSMCTSADARPELVFNQITGGSSGIRCFDHGAAVDGRGRARAVACRGGAAVGAAARDPCGRRRRRDRSRRAHRRLTGAYRAGVVACRCPPTCCRSRPSQYNVIGKRHGPPRCARHRHRPEEVHDGPGRCPTQSRRCCACRSQIRGTVVQRQQPRRGEGDAGRDRRGRDSRPGGAIVPSPPAWR